jgi:translation initiation factor 3 subunit G
MRAGASRAGESMRGPGNREDMPTLRVTNISEDTQENDLRELFGGFGRIARVYVGRDRETGAGKGFAFVSFEDRAAAEKAQEKVNGKGYDNLILSVQWSREFSLLFFPSFVAHCRQNLVQDSRTCAMHCWVCSILQVIANHD